MADTEVKELFKSFRFKVEVDNESGSSVVAGFSQFSGIKMRVDVISARPGDEKRGVLDTYPGLTSYENVIFSKGVVGDNEFLDWILSVAPSETAPPTGNKIRRSITVTALNDKGLDGVAWTLIGCMPVAYSLSPFDSGQSGIVSESLELAISGFKRETKK